MSTATSRSIREGNQSPHCEGLLFNSIIVQYCAHRILCTLTCVFSLIIGRINLTTIFVYDSDVVAALFARRLYACLRSGIDGQFSHEQFSVGRNSLTLFATTCILLVCNKQWRSSKGNTTFSGPVSFSSSFLPFI